MIEQQICPFIPLNNNIYCQRLKKMGSKKIGQFDLLSEKTNDNVSIGYVLAVGKDVKEINVGDIITIPLMNTLRHYFDSIEYLITQESMIVSKLDPTVEVTTEF